MVRRYFLETERIGFSEWNTNDGKLAGTLWGDPEVTRYICSRGTFSKRDIKERLDKEIRNNEKYHMQYWPIFNKINSELIGCCGLRPWEGVEGVFELGFYLCRGYWGQGYASEAAQAVIIRRIA